MRYRGTLEIEATRGSGGLPVEFTLSDRFLTVTTDGDFLGKYPLSDVHVSRVASDRFDLRIGSEELVFTADDALRFSYEAMPFISSATQESPIQLLTRVKNWWKAWVPGPERGPDQPPPAPAPSPAPSPLPEETAPPVNPDFRPQPAPSPSLSDLRRRFGTEHQAEEEDSEPPAAGPIAPAPASEPAPEHEPEPAPEPARPEPPVAEPTVAEPAAPEPPAAEPVGMGAARETCKGLRADGSPCGSAVVSERGFCFAHDPERVVERRMLQDQTTRAVQRVRRSGRDMEDVLSRLERAVIEVHEGRLDPQQALAMASLAQAMIDTIELSNAVATRKSDR